MDFFAASEWCGGWLASLVIGIVICYVFVRSPWNYWDSQPLDKVIKRKSIVGVLINAFFPKKKPYIESERENYQKYGRLFGTYEGGKPLLSLAEPELIKRVLVKDFSSFPNRRPIIIGDPIFDHSLLALQDEDWKRVRTIITPTFSGNKMKQMTDLVKQCSQSVAEYFLEAAEKDHNIVDVKNYFGTFTMDAIASCAFGIKIESQRDPQNPFVTHAKRMFAGSSLWKVLLFFTFPRLAKYLGFKLVPQDVVDFFKHTIEEIIERRRRGTECRNDFLQLLLECQKQDPTPANADDQPPSSFPCDDENTKIPHTKPGRYKELSEEELAGQCLMFFLAGYDTTSSALTFAAYNLALHPECQERLIEEIDARYAEKGDLDYEDVTGGRLPYLDAVIWETLRLYPAVMRLLRTASVDYLLGETGIVIPKGGQITIPIMAMHRDPEFFPNPDSFDPLRFLSSSSSSPSTMVKNNYAYLPFGAGPRNCIGMRLALMQAKLCLAHVLRLVRFSPCQETTVPPVFLQSMGLVRAKPILLRVQKRDGKE